MRPAQPAPALSAFSFFSAILPSYVPSAGTQQQAQGNLPSAQTFFAKGLKGFQDFADGGSTLPLAEEPLGMLKL